MSSLFDDIDDGMHVHGDDIHRWCAWCQTNGEKSNQIVDVSDVHPFNICLLFVCLLGDDIFAAPAKPKKLPTKKPSFEQLLDDDSEELFVLEKDKPKAADNSVNNTEVNL